jgi:hypothetical protein
LIAAEDQSDSTSEEAYPNLKRLRLSNIKQEELLRYEIMRKRTSRKKYQKMANDLGFKEIKGMTGLSVKEGNVDALMGLAQSNVYAVTAELQKPEYTQFFAQKNKANQDSFIPQLFFMVRAHAPKSFKIMLQRLTRSIILRTSLNISGRGSKGKSRHRVRYYPGMPEFDLDATLFNYLQNGAQYLSFSDIVGYERRQRKRNVVLILDTSGSMFGKLLLNAALTTSVLSYAMAKDFTSVILFNSDAFVLKSIKKETDVVHLIDSILESEAVGFTNIERALKQGLLELKKIKGDRQKVGILITDGDFNRGKEPFLIARRYPKLHVINMPPEEQKIGQTRGQTVCRGIAAAGKGLLCPSKGLWGNSTSFNGIIGQNLE